MEATKDRSRREVGAKSIMEDLQDREESTMSMRETIEQRPWLQEMVNNENSIQMCCDV